MKTGDYVSRRVAARAILAAAAAVVATGSGAALNAAVVRGDHPRELLWEPRRTTRVEAPQSPAPRPPEPTPSDAPPVEPPPVEPPPPPVVVESYDFEVALPLADGNKPELKDFRIDVATGTQYRVVAMTFDRKLHRTAVKNPLKRVALVVDLSSSMKGMDSQNHRYPGMRKFIQNIPASVQIPVFSFGSKSNANGWEQQVDGVRGHQQSLQAVDTLEAQEGGNTPTYGALVAALNDMATVDPTSRSAIVCFTDGAPHDVNLKDDVKGAAVRAGVPIWFVALGGSDPEWAANTEIANSTGGKIVRVEQAEDLGKAFVELARQFDEREEITARLRIRASRRGSAFSAGELLTPTVRVGSNGPPLPYQIPVDTSRVRRTTEAPASKQPTGGVR